MHIGLFQFVAIISLISWIILFLFRGRFWLSNKNLETDFIVLDTWPSVSIVIPARDEEENINTALRSLLTLNYPGKIDITVINDNSSDNTVEEIGRVKSKTITLLNSSELPDGWTGKLWALRQGVDFSKKHNPFVDYYLFTDADIEHSPDILSRLVIKAEKEYLHLASLMVLLNCDSFWEKLLIPAFVFFFQKLYPFKWINDPKRTTAGAAGGYLLLKRTALEAAGGVDTIRGEIIDDCAIARMIKKKGSIWLGLTTDIKSLRKYSRLSEIWAMVIRTAFDQLGYSTLVLIATIVGMMIIYILPPTALTYGLLFQDYLLLVLGGFCWSMMTVAYLPTQRLYRRPVWEALLIPVAAILYSLMAIDSALKYWTNQNPSWKGRKYSK